MCFRLSSVLFFPLFLEALNSLPPTEYRTTSENIVTTAASGALFDGDRRFQLTGERDFSREPSFLHHSSGKLRDLPLTHSTPERNSSSGINNYGYDVHEVHTSGKTIIVQLKYNKKLKFKLKGN